MLCHVLCIKSGFSLSLSYRTKQTVTYIIDGWIDRGNMGRILDSRIRRDPTYLPVQVGNLEFMASGRQFDH